MSPEQAINGVNALCDYEEWPTIGKSLVAKHTTNPIRNIVDRLKIPPNPSLPMISLGLGTILICYLGLHVRATGDPTVFGNLRAPASVLDAVHLALQNPRNSGYPPATGTLHSHE